MVSLAVANTIVAGAITPSPLLRDLVAYWPLEEDAGLARADVVGRLYLADTNDVPAAAAVADNGADFTGASSQYLSRPFEDDLLDPADTSFTFAVWVRFDSLADDQPILTKYTSDANRRQYRLFYENGTDRLVWRVSSDGSGNTAVSAGTFGAPSTATWYCIFCGYDAEQDEAFIRVNATATDTAAHAGGIYTSTAEFHLGHQFKDTKYLSGTLDEIGYWSRRLSPAEMNLFYNDGNGTTYPFAGARAALDAVPIVLATDSTKAGTAARLPRHRQVFYAAGLYWIFFGRYDAAAGPYDLCFATSADGQTWAVPTVLDDFPGYDAQWTVFLDPDTGTRHIAKNIQTGVVFHDGLEYRRGTPAANGTIAWDAAWQTVLATGNYAGDLDLAVDTAGHAWLAYSDASDDATLLKNDNTDGTWSDATGFPVTLTGSGDGRFAILTPLAAGGMHALVYKWAADIPATGYYSDDGSASFTAEGNITENNMEADSGTGANVARIEAAGLRDGAVHYAYQAADWHIYYGYRDADNTYADEIEISPHTGGYTTDVISSPRISFDGDDNPFVIWTAAATGEVYACYLVAGEWSDPTLLWTYPAEDTYEHLMPAHLAHGTLLPLAHLSDAFELLFRLVDMATIAPTATTQEK